MRILDEAEALREEPELRDFDFDPHEVERAVNHLVPKYEERLDRAKKRSEEELEEVYDELRVEAVERILTREWRKEFLKRLDNMVRRLMNGSDGKKLEQALVVRMMLDEKSVPWGSNPVVSMIFEDAKEKISERYTEAEEMMLDLFRGQNPDATEEELRALIHDPERIKELSDSLIIPPDVMEKLEEMTENALEQFETDLFNGETELDLFTLTELDEVIARINRYALAQGLSILTKPSTAALEGIANVVAEFVTETVTPDRLSALKDTLDAIETEWLAVDHPSAALLGIESEELAEIEPRENHFLYCVLIGQIRRAGMQDETEDPSGD